MHYKVPDYLFWYYHFQCSVLALDESALDVDQVENLIKFCPTKEEMELLKVYLFPSVQVTKFSGLNHIVFSCSLH